MKKFLMVLVVASLVATSAFAQAGLDVNATVSDYLTVSLSATSLNFTLDGDGAASTSTSTSTLTAVSNKKAWTISFDSANAGLLISDTVGVTDEIPYLLQATFVEPTPAWTRGTLTNGLSTPINPEGKTIVVTDGKTPKAGVTFTLQASILAQASTDILFEADNAYSDTITISIAAN